MVMFLRTGICIYKSQVTGHAEMNDQCSGIASDQQIFGPTIDRVDDAPGQAFLEIRLDRPAKPTFADDNTGNRRARQAWRNAATRRFNFR